MKPLVWKTAPPRIDERASGFLILLLILLMLHVLKPAPNRPSALAFPCRDPLYVQVEGEVKNPGVYSFCGEPRAEDVIRRAGTCRSCESFHPRGTAALTSGQKVLLIRDGSTCDVSVGDMGAYYKVSLSIPLSVNRESQEGLTAIPGIGFNLAGAIVRARVDRGGFKTLDDVATVPGIGKALYRKIKPYLTL